MDSKFTDDDGSPDERADSSAGLSFREADAGRPVEGEARAEVRDRETYYAELLLAVHGQSREIPAPRVALDDQDLGTRKRRPDDGSWDDMIARFGDTWT